MKRNHFTVEQIIRMLRKAEVHVSQGKSVKLVSRDWGLPSRPITAGGKNMAV
jgi:hypothetical protein